MPRVLFVVSSARQMPLADGTPHPTGFFADGALTPYERFIAAGVDVVVATPDGKPPFADSYGLEKTSRAENRAHLLSRADVDAAIEAVPADSRRESGSIAQRLSEIPGFRRPVNLGEMSAKQMGEFDAVFAPGGHGPMVDLADNPDVTRLLGTLHRKRATIAALCHGPAMLLSAPANLDGQWLFDGYRMTAFTDEEESQTPSGKLGMQWYLETALRNAGAVFDDGRSAWSPHVVVDRNLVTGQNPNSAKAIADAVLKSLNAL
jgi:putative intracellular protease/amidase